MLNRLVPVAPSARRTEREARRDSSDVRMATPWGATAKRIAPETSCEIQCSSSSDSVIASDGTRSGSSRSVGGKSTIVR